MINHNKRVIKIVLLVLLVTMFQGNVLGAFADEEFPDFEEGRAQARIIAIRDVETPDPNYITLLQEVDVEITRGPFKGQLLMVENAHTDNPAFDLVLEEGDKIVLILELVDEGIQNAYIEDFYRMDMVYVLIAIFALLVLWIGRWQGARSLLTLVLTIVFIWWILVPLALQGVNPILVSILVAVLAIATTFIIVSGWNEKSLVAIIGTSGGIVMAGVLAVVFSSWGHLTGMSMQESQMLTYAPTEIAYNFRGLLLAGIIVGALGAIMDIGMSIASALFEMRKQGCTMTKAAFWQAGMNIGRDVMGTMVNTLILAYAGTALPLLMLFKVYEMPLMRVLNMDLVVSEIVRSLAGSIGLICCIPLTVIVAAVIYTRKYVE